MNHKYLTALCALAIPVSAGAVDVVLPTDNIGVLHLIDPGTGNQIDPESLDPDFDTTWFDLATYNGPAFVDGPGPVEYGIINGIPAPGTSLIQPTTGSRQTVYFRRTFDIGANTLTNVSLTLLSDDGCIIYVDGVPYRSLNMPVLSSDYFQFATAVGDEDNFSILTTQDDFFTPLANIGPGVHTLAISVHQSGTASSDIGLSLMISGDLIPIPEPSSVMSLIAASGLASLRRRRK